jgi:hypothetical protein
MLDVAELQLGNAEVDNCSLQGPNPPNLTMPTVQFATMTSAFKCKTSNFYLIAIVIRQDDSLTNDSSSQLQSIDTTAHQWDGSLSIATISQSTDVQQWCEPPSVTPLISMATLSVDEAVWLNMPSVEESRSAAQ